jgi:hypothetical protein
MRNLLLATVVLLGVGTAAQAGPIRRTVDTPTWALMEGTEDGSGRLVCILQSREGPATISNSPDGSLFIILGSENYRYHGSGWHRSGPARETAPLPFRRLNPDDELFKDGRAAAVGFNACVAAAAARR